MSLAHAILGFLQDRDLTGYDLKVNCFDHSIAHFWPADQAQIYRTLDKLAEDGAITSRIEVQGERPNRKLYSITEAGRVELSRWLNQPQPLPAHREAFLIQLYFADRLPNTRIRDLIADQIHQHRDQLALYQQIPLPSPENADLPRDLHFQRFTLDMGIQIETMYITWLNDCLRQLDSMPDRE